MGSEWIKRRIGSLGRVVTGKTPSTSDPSNYGGSFPFITIPDLGSQVFVSRTGRAISQKGANAIRSSLLPPGAVMMSCIATIGKCGITVKPSFTNQQINSVIPREAIDARFLYYIFSQLGEELESAGGGGSVYTNVSKSRFSDIEISFPKDISEQKAIAHILGTLDDKIELNRKRSETLEAMARALFKSWFVDFDPVVAKMEGRWKQGESLPGMPADLWELFPDKLVDSELGEIPEGWEVAPLHQLMNITMGQSPPSRYYNEEGNGLPFHQGVRDFGNLYPTHRVFCTLQKRTASQGDILLSVRAPVGRINLTDSKIVIGRGLAALRSSRGFATHAHYLIKHIFSEEDSFGDGTIYKAITKTFLFEIPVVAPPVDILQGFESTASCMDQQLTSNDSQNSTLMELRDTLLPKLISGELRVKDADKFLSKAGV